jgi:hypothetical protein
MFGLLQIYDGDDEDTVDTAGDRGGVAYSVAVTGGRAGFVNAMKNLVARGQPYTRVIIETHGGPGEIRFNDEFVDAAMLRVHFGAMDFSRLFPLYTRMYFNGCNVAENGAGWNFLEAAGSIFLKAGGGEVFAHTSAGYAFPGWVPVIGSHTVHFSGDTRYVEVGRGGTIVKRYSPSEGSRKARSSKPFRVSRGRMF